MNLLVLVAVSAVALVLGFAVPGANPTAVALVVIVGAGFGATLIKPLYGLCFLAFSMLLSPEIGVGGVAGGSRAVVVRVDDILLVVVFVTWLARTALSKDVEFLKSTPVSLPIFLYTAAFTVSTALGILRGDIPWMRGFFYALKYIEYFFLFFMVVNTVRSKSEVRLLLGCALATAIIVTLYGYGTFAVMGAGYRVTAPFEAPIGKPEEAEPASIGGYFILVLCSLLAFYTQNRERWASALGLLAVLVLPPFLLTLSRASYGAFLAAFAFLLATTNRKRLNILGGGAVAGLIVFLAAPAMRDLIVRRVAFTFTGRGYADVVGRQLREVNIGPGAVRLEDSAAARISSLKRVLKEDFPDNPFFGAGVTGIRFVDSQYGLILGEAGLLGLGIFLWLIRRVFLVAWDLARRREDDPLARSLGYALLASTVGLLVQAIGTNTFIIVRIMEPFWLLAALASRYHVGLPEESVGAPRESVPL